MAVVEGGLNDGKDGSIGSGPSSPFLYLPPGEVAVATSRTVIVTIVGSCVAVCVHDSKHGVGGMNHFVVPTSLSTIASPRFGEAAVATLIERLLAAGCERANLVAKVFGGACLLGTPAFGRAHLGALNVRSALALLAAEAIPVVAEDVDGLRGRKVLFCTDSGWVWVRQL